MTYLNSQLLRKKKKGEKKKKEEKKLYPTAFLLKSATIQFLYGLIFFPLLHFDASELMYLSVRSRKIAKIIIANNIKNRRLCRKIHMLN